MAVETVPNPLISTQKSSDANLEIALHPLVLLTISDYLTRHTLRQQKGPIVGALLGQQDGKAITIEHAFDCALVEVDGQIVLDDKWFTLRLQQMKDVHKVPPLELVGWYTTMSTAGPQPIHLPIHTQIQNYAESSSAILLLGFHPTAVLEGNAGGKLPISIYESEYEADDQVPATSGEDKEMKDGEAELVLKFKELSYSVETGEAEMISVDFVARGGGNATAVDSSTTKTAPTAATKTAQPEGKGKTRAPKQKITESTDVDEQNTMSREDEELIASLTAKANAIKMLHARINLIALYLESLSVSKTSANTTKSPETTSNNTSTSVNHSILRSILALLSRLSLLIPVSSTAFEQELTSEQNDVHLVSLLSTITESINGVREAGRKFHIVDNGRGRTAKTGLMGVNLPGSGSWGLPYSGSSSGGGGGGSSGGGMNIMGVGDLMTS